MGQMVCGTEMELDGVDARTDHDAAHTSTDAMTSCRLVRSGSIALPGRRN
jgi:hypothetical protein